MRSSLQRLLIGVLTLMLCIQAGSVPPIAAPKPLSAPEPASPGADDDPRAELFDVSRGKVVLYIPVTVDLRHAAESWLAEIRGIAVGLRLLPDRGYIIKIPFRPPMESSSVHFRGSVRELYLMWDPSSQSVYSKILLLEPDGSPRVFLLSTDIGPYKERWLQSVRRGQSQINSNPANTLPLSVRRAPSESLLRRLRSIDLSEP